MEFSLRLEILLGIRWLHMTTRTIVKLVSIVIGGLLFFEPQSLAGQDLASLPKQWRGSQSIKNLVFRGDPYLSRPRATAHKSTNKRWLSAREIQELQDLVKQNAHEVGDDQLVQDSIDALSAFSNEGCINASDPFNLDVRITGQWEWQHLSNNAGDLVAFKVGAAIPFCLGRRELLFRFDVPLPQHAALNGASHSTGFGDTRLALYAPICAGNDNVLSIVPGLDTIAPTGDEGRGLGGGNWITMPSLAFAIQPARNWSMYPVLRYVHGDSVATNFVPALPLPEAPGLFATSDLSALNLQWTNVLQLNDAFFDWVEFTPDYLKNFAADRGETFTMKYTIAKQVRAGLFTMVDFWHPVGGSHSNDYTFKVRLDWYPNADGPRCPRCRARKRICRCR